MQPGSAAPRYWKFDASSRGGLAVQLWLSLRPAWDKTQSPATGLRQLRADVSPGWMLDAGLAREGRKISSSWSKKMLWELVFVDWRVGWVRVGVGEVEGWEVEGRWRAGKGELG